ncbi:MAG: hypothetical protein EOO43_23525, partial [Flavobacterium sp.]
MGGTMQEPVPNQPPGNYTGRYIAWKDSDTFGTNYFSGPTGTGNPISLAAAAQRVGAYMYIPSQGAHYFNPNVSGTSVASPLVAMTMAMMKILNSSLSVPELKNIVTHTSTLRTYSNTQNYVTPRYLGKNLEVSTINQGSKVGIRDLNMYNALVVAFNKKYYSHIVRSHNIGDEIYSSHYT